MVARRGVVGGVVGHLAGRQVDALRDGLLDVGAVAPDADDDALADLDGGDLAGVDLAEVLDEVLEALAGAAESSPPAPPTSAPLSPSPPK